VHRRAGAIALVAATVVAIGRVFLGVHYLSDVVAGAARG
jgi:membrane-associated phospholipid phosphatase